MRMDTPSPTATGSFSTADGTRIFTQRWCPDSPRAAVALVHGYAEHSGRYAHVAGYLNAHDIAVHTYDQRGFGRSEGRRALVTSFDQLLDDLQRFLDRMRRKLHDDMPLFLFGHSMGGALCALYAIERSQAFHGLLLSSPAVEVDDDIAPFLRKMASVIGRIFPTLPTIQTPDDAISRDPAVVAAAQADPLNYNGRVLAQTGAEFIRAAERIQTHMAAIALPLLVFHGTADKLTSPHASQMLYEQARSPDKTLNLYDGLYHETLNEPEKEQVLADIVTWLDARL
jgi:alpha-beta hydrolase superfamily lysophospholipase